MLYNNWKLGTLSVPSVTPILPSLESNLFKTNNSTYSSVKRITFLPLKRFPLNVNEEKQESLPVTEGERQNLRGLIGSLQYAATDTRPDLSARLSFLQSKINCATIKDLLEANRLLGDAKTHADVSIKIASMPCDDVRIVAYSDASFATREKLHSQKGGLFFSNSQGHFLTKEVRLQAHCLGIRKRLIVSLQAPWHPKPMRCHPQWTLPTGSG